MAEVKTKKKVPKKAPLNEKIERSVQCNCKGDCKFRINDKILNDMKMDYCSEHLHVLAYTKIK